MNKVKQNFSKINKSNTFFNFKNFNKILFLFVFLLSMYFFVSINDLTVQGFHLQKLRQQANNLVEENKEIEFKTTTLESYSDLIKRAEELSMIQVDGLVDYVVLRDELMAKR